MILQIERLPIEQPKISLNQLGQFPFATPKKKLEMLRNQKFGNSVCAPYYMTAHHAIMRSFKNGVFQHNLLLEEADKIKPSDDYTRNKLKRLENNLQAVLNFMNIGEAAHPHPGVHRIVWRNAKIPLNGVIVSARPEIITEDERAGYFAFTKLRFSKSKASADAQEIALLVLLHYGQQQSHGDLSFSIEKSRLIDCFSKNVLAGHTIPRHRDQQLHEALAEIRAMWPYIQPIEDNGR